MSLLSRGAWIEIIAGSGDITNRVESLLSRGAWIEIECKNCPMSRCQ